MVEEIERSANIATNQAFNTADIVKIRLGVTDILENIEMNLRGEYLSVTRDEKTGRHKLNRIKSGEKKANAAGVQAILSWVSNIVNTAVVQGNFVMDKKTGRSEQYDNYLHDVHVSLISHLILNSKEWDIKDSNADIICDSIMNLVEPFMTRLIDNKERESYNATLRAEDKQTIITPQSRGLPFV